MSTYRIDGIKYNPANWAGLAPSERAACNRFAAARGPVYSVLQPHKDMTCDRISDAAAQSRSQLVIGQGLRICPA